MSKPNKYSTVFCILFLFLSSGPLSAQMPLSVGFDLMGNVLQGDFNSHPLFFSGDIYGKYDLNRWVSLCAAFTFGELKMSLDVNERSRIRFPEKIRNDYSSGEIYGAVPVIKSAFIFEVDLGIEFLHFDPETNDNTILPPAIFSKDVFGLIVGGAFETPLNEKISLHAKLMVHLPSTEFLDNYQTGSNDKFTTFGVGLSYNFSKNQIANVDTSSTAKRSWNGQIDSDGDGIGDDDEVNLYHTDPKKADTDDDGLNDFQEIFNARTDPHKPDTDNDGLYDGEEVNKYHTDPLSHDSDGDGLDDGYEVNIIHTDPTNHDTDDDGIWDKEDKCPLVRGKAPSGCP